MSKSKQDVRKRFRESCLARDKNCCVMCGAKGDENIHLDIHHVTNRKGMPGGGYVKENGITLCDREPVDGQISCHQKAESWWKDGSLQNRGQPGFDPESLYQKIGSSFAMALAASKKL